MHSPRYEFDRLLVNKPWRLLRRLAFISPFYLAIFCVAAPPSFAAVSVTVSPASANLAPNGTQQFTATVTGASDTSVTWTIQQGAGGGAILASGLYTAPATVGVYTVVATSNADNTQSAAATVSVAGFFRTGLLNPSPNTATLLLSGSVLYIDGATGAAEIYDPASASSMATGSMTIPRLSYSATLLRSGKVLVAGGQSSSQTTAAAELYDPATGIFTATGSLTVPREGQTATTLQNGKVLIVGGNISNCASSCFYNSAEIYDPAAGTFSPTAGALPVAPAMPTASPLGTATSILLSNGNVLIAGGGIGGAAELYNPSLDSFAQTGALINQNDAFSATLLQNGNVLFVTGGITEASASTAEIYDAVSGIFTATGNLALARSFVTATLLNTGQVLMVGGQSTAQAEIFDPATGKFSLTGSLQEARANQTATVLANGEVLIAGGSGVTQGISSVEVYSESAKTFSSTSVFLKTARSDQASVQLQDGRLLLTGGEDTFSNVLASAELYNPASGVFTFTGSMAEARHGHTATLLADGTVLIVGGYSDSAGPKSGTILVTSSEIYNPSAGTFSSLASSTNIARAYHTATLLPSGEVLIAGGVTLAGSQGPTLSAEIYDPVAQTFTIAGNMSAVRYNHAATLLNDGRVLISDGLTKAGTPGNGIGLDELYDPSSGLFTQAGPKEVVNNATAPPTASVLLENGQVLADNQSIFDAPSNSLTALSSLINLQTLLQDYNFALLPSGQVFTTSNSYPTYLFDPVAQTFTQADSLQYFRSRPTLYALPNGEVMVAGGANIAQVEFYVPEAESSNPAPSLSTINPISVVAGSAGFTLLAGGSNFVSNSTVNFNGEARATTFVSSTQLSAVILAGDIANTESATITVTNPSGGAAGSATSNPLTLTILAANVQPVVGTLSPASTTAGGAAFLLSVFGSGFTQSSAVTFNGNSVTVSFISSTQLQANISSSAIAAAGSFLVSVANAGGNPSTVVSFTVNNPVPQATLLSPGNVTAGSAALTLGVSGSNFNSASTVLINAAARATTFVSSTLLQAGLTANDLLQGATLTVSVSNPAPGGGTTSTLPFTVLDYTVAVPEPTAPTVAGQTVVINLTVAPSSGTFTNPVAFTVTQLPQGAAASFSPSASVTPGSASQTVTLSITTTAHSLSGVPAFPGFGRPDLSVFRFAGIGAVFAAMFWIGLGKFVIRRRRLLPRLIVATLLVAGMCLAACSGGGGSGGSSAQLNTASGTPAGTYTIIVTATSGGIAHSASATFTVI